MLGPEAEPLGLAGQARFDEEAQQPVYVPLLDRAEADNITHRAIEPRPPGNGTYLFGLSHGPGSLGQEHPRSRRKQAHTQGHGFCLAGPERTPRGT